MLSRKSGNVTSYAYDTNTDLVTSVSSGSSAVPYTYGNGTRIGFVYDNLDRLTEKKYNDATKVTYHYNKMGQLMYDAFKRQWGGDARWSFYDYLDLAILQCFDIGWYMQWLIIFILTTRKNLNEEKMDIFIICSC